MGTAVALASIHTSTIKLSPGERAFWYWLVWVVSIIGIVLWAALRSKRWARWTTQDILIVAALGVLLEVYDNIIGDQFIGPLIAPMPGADFTQVQDLPYMFLLMVGVALVRKPGPAGCGRHGGDCLGRVARVAARSAASSPATRRAGACGRPRRERWTAGRCRYRRVPDATGPAARARAGPGRIRRTCAAPRRGCAAPARWASAR